jgi:hypothetical protein
MIWFHGVHPSQYDSFVAPPPLIHQQSNIDSAKRELYRFLKINKTLLAEFLPKVERDKDEDVVSQSIKAMELRAEDANINTII